MSRNSWIMFGMIAVVIMSIVLVALLILVPQSEPIIDASIDEYEAIDPSEFSYTQSKDISQEAMKETYSVTTEDVKEGKASKLYKQGNTDPFADPNANENTNSNGNNNSSNTNTSSSNTNNVNNVTNSGSNVAGDVNNTAGGASNNTQNDKPVSAEDK